MFGNKSIKIAFNYFGGKEVRAFREKFADDLRRPVFDWSAQQVIDYILDAGLEPNPPHLNKIGANTWMAQKYGVLFPTWETDLKAGFNECMRVLKPEGVLIFKWNEAQVKTSKIIEIFGQQPLFGHPTSKHGKTIWLCFMKK